MLKARLVTCLLLACAALLLPRAGVADGDDDGATGERDGRVLVIGKVSDNPKKHYEYLRPMVEFAAERMTDIGVTGGEVLMAPSNDAMLQYLRQGRVDWVTETVFSALIFQEEAGAELLVRKWKKGVPEYRTVIFTRTDSGIETLEDLRGRTIALEDPGSSSAFFVPASMLIEAGLKLVRLMSPRDQAPPDAVGYVFSSEEINSSTWVYRGLVDAAAIGDLDWEKEDHTPSAYREELKIIARSEPLVRAVELVRADLEPEISERLKRILLSAGDDPEARDVLRSYQKTQRFDELTEDILAQLEDIRKVLHLVRSETAE